MADLFDRIYNNNPDDELPKMGYHHLAASLVLYFSGVFTSVQVKTFWNMDVNAQADWDALVINLDAEPDNTSKMIRLHRLEAAGAATEAGAIATKAAYKSAAGIT